MNTETVYYLLVVEDNPLQLQLVTDLFTLQRAAAGRFRVVTAETLREALDAIGSRSFDAVLLDLALPDSAGLATFRALNAAAPDVPIIVWSGHADEETALVAMREGAQEYLPKGDVSPVQLVRTISHLIERARAERKARHEGQRVTTILDATPDCMKLLDRNGNVMRINAAGLAMLETDYDDVVGRSALEFVVPAHHSIVRNMIEAVYEGDSIDTEFQIVSRSGSVRWVSSRAVPLRSTDNAITAVLSITRDVTLQKHTEHALAESEEYFRLLVENLTDVVCLIDPKGTILYISSAVEPMLGFSPEEVIGESAWRFVHPDDTPGLQQRERSRLQGDEAATLSEVRMLHANGGWRVIQMRARLYPGGRYGEPALLITMRDITENKRIEEDLRRTQEELLHVQKLEAVGRLAGGVAHDFNNLLTAISGHADLLLEQVSESAEARAEVDEIKHGVQRAAALTRQLLAFSRKQVMQPTVLDLHVVVNEMRRMLGRLIGENIELVTNGTEAGASIRADRGQIEQVIMNLVVNARDAMPQGGRVTITTNSIEVTATEPHPSGATPGSYVCVAVADTGVGMQKEVLDHIFEPFFTTKEVGKGTGLGLATVYGIVKQSGGFINVASDLGKGTRIELLLPRVAQVAGKVALPITPAAASKMSGTILIVEDEKTVRDVASRVLMRAGYDVLAAGDGLEALEVGAQRLDDVNLVLTDVIMPRLNGPDLVARLRALRPGIRVLFTSGYTDDAVFPHGIVTPDVGFLEKPFTPASLLDAVRKAIGGEAR